MNYKGYDSSVGRNATEVASHSFDLVDSFFNRLESLAKTKTQYDAVQNELKTKVADLDLHARYYGVGSVYQDPKTGQVKLDTQSASQWPVPPVVQAQIPYVMAAAGASPQQIGQTMLQMRQSPQPPGTPPSAALPAGAGIQIPATGGGAQPSFQWTVPSAGGGTTAVGPASGSAPIGVMPNGQGGFTFGSPSVGPGSSIGQPTGAIANAMQSGLTNPILANAPPIQKRAIGARVVGQAINNAMVPATKAAEDTAKAQIEADAGFKDVMAVVGDAVRDWKAASQQSRGRGVIGDMSNAIALAFQKNNTSSLQAYNETARTMGIKLATQLSGGSRGAVTLFTSLFANIPKPSANPQNAGDTFASMIKQAYALRRGADLMGKDLASVDSPEEAKKLVRTGMLTNEQARGLNDAIQDMFEEIEPQQPIGMEKSNRAKLVASSEDVNPEDAQRLRAMFGGRLKSIKKVA